MILDDFDQKILADSEGSNASDFLLRNYGKTIAPTNAKKYKAGIIWHLKLKQKIAEPGGKGWDEVVTRGDGSKTTQRMVMLSESDANDPTRIMQLMGYDPLQWELINCKTRRNDWDVTMKNVHTQGAFKETNHQYRILCHLNS